MHTLHRPVLRGFSPLEKPSWVTWTLWLWQNIIKHNKKAWPTFYMIAAKDKAFFEQTGCLWGRTRTFSVCTTLKQGVNLNTWSSSFGQKVNVYSQTGVCLLPQRNIEDTTTSVLCRVCGSRLKQIKFSQKKEIPFLSPTVKASLLRGDSVACRRLALKSVRDLKQANPFLSVRRAKDRQKWQVKDVKA